MRHTNRCAMSSVSPASKASYAKDVDSRFVELVKKIETSPTELLLKRRKLAKKKLYRAIREQRRQAKRAGLRAVALTLTYRDSSTFDSKHVSRFIDKLRRSLRRQGYGLPYAWVLERAGQLHYHLLLWLPRGQKLEAILSKWWCWGSCWIESCRSPSGWGRYMSKFNSLQKLPKGARAFGLGGLDEEGKAAVSRAGMPRWLLAVLPQRHLARRCRGGGWVDTTTGLIYVSPYIWTPRGIVFAPSPLTGSEICEI